MERVCEYGSAVVLKTNLFCRVDWDHVSQYIWEGENFCVWKGGSKRKKLRNNKIRLDFSEEAVACFFIFGYLAVGFTHVVG